MGSVVLFPPERLGLLVKVQQRIRLLEGSFPSCPARFSKSGAPWVAIVRRPPFQSAEGLQQPPSSQRSRSPSRTPDSRRKAPSCASGNALALSRRGSFSAALRSSVERASLFPRAPAPRPRANSAPKSCATSWPGLTLHASDGWRSCRGAASSLERPDGAGAKARARQGEGRRRRRRRRDCPSRRLGPAQASCAKSSVKRRESDGRGIGRGAASSLTISWRCRWCSPAPRPHARQGKKACGSPRDDGARRRRRAQSLA